MPIREAFYYNHCLTVHCSGEIFHIWRLDLASIGDSKLHFTTQFFDCFYNICFVKSSFQFGMKILASQSLFTKTHGVASKAWAKVVPSLKEHIKGFILEGSIVTIDIACYQLRESRKDTELLRKRLRNNGMVLDHNTKHFEQLTEVLEDFFGTNYFSFNKLLALTSSFSTNCCYTSIQR